jgi:predicted nicotinamide N-methyase
MQDSKEALGGKVWKGALALLAYLEDAFPSVGGLRILELGAGTGVLSIALTLADPPPELVVMSDQACVLELLQANARRCCGAGGGGDWKTVQLDWLEGGGRGLGVKEALGLAGEAGFDLVLAADCVYWEHLYAPFIEVLEAVCGARTRVLVCNDDARTAGAAVEAVTGQRWDASFFAMLYEAGFDCRDLPVMEAVGRREGGVPGGPFRLVECCLRGAG